MQPSDKRISQAREEHEDDDDGQDEQVDEDEELLAGDELHPDDGGDGKRGELLGKDEITHDLGGKAEMELSVRIEESI